MRIQWTLLALLLLSATMPIIAQNDSPCNQGRSSNDPRNPEAICLPELGSRGGFLTGCDPNGQGEQYGWTGIYPVGDVDHSGTQDWIVSHQRCDLSVASRFPIDLVLYHGVVGGLPEINSGERIGPSEPASVTSFVAAGDWDGDGWIDLACRVQLMYDSSAGNVDGYDIAQLVVFWNDQTGHYSIADTTRLVCEAQMWLGISQSVSCDLNNDGTADLFVRNSNGLTNGQVLWMPKVHLFSGHKGTQWGRQGIGHTADWTWATPPVFGNAIYAIDQDADGNVDISFHDNARIAVLYGARNGFPDIDSAEVIDLKVGGGSNFVDVTGDRIPELVTCGGQVAHIYLGLKGQRLTEQYGSGNDAPRPGEKQWWGKPWAELWQPNKVNPNWFADNGTLMDFGDGDLDGLNDIWTFSWPYVLMYRSGDRMDSLVDALVDIRPGSEIETWAWLGDIDSSGVPTMALVTNTNIRYIKPSPDVSKTGIYRKLPEGTGPAGVGEDRGRRTQDAGESLDLQAAPNPAHDAILITWRSVGYGGVGTVMISDAVGREKLRQVVSPLTGSLHVSTQGWPPGMYIISLVVGDQHTDVALIVR